MTDNAFSPPPVVSGADETIPEHRAASFPHTILLVDDEQRLRALGSAQLSSLGFSVLTAANGHEALKIYRGCRQQIKLVMMDLLMPEMGGVEAYRKLRELSPALPIVICSGYRIAEVSEISGSDRYAGFLLKPYKMEQLRSALTRLLSLSRRTAL